MYFGSIAVIVMLIATVMPAKAVVIDDLVGRWQGNLAVADGSQPVRFGLSGDADGFDLDLTIDGRTLARMTFAPADRPGVFVQEGRKGLLSMFKDDETVNPLTGVPLIWSRIADDELVVYRLHIESNGAYLLDRVSVAPAGDTAMIERTRLRHGEPVSRSEGRLVRGGAN